MLLLSRQVEGHILETAVKAVKTTAEDVAAVLDKVRQEIAAAEGEGHEEDDQPWVGPWAWLHQGMCAPCILYLKKQACSCTALVRNVGLGGHAVGCSVGELGCKDTKSALLFMIRSVQPLAQVHSGFLTAYDSLRPALLGLLAALLEGEQGHWTLQMTGHSLGGALATLAAWDCAHRR